MQMMNRHRKSYERHRVAPLPKIPPAPVLRFEVHRVDAYTTTIPNAVQPNAWWDAVALREKVLADEAAEAEQFGRGMVGA